MMAQPRSSRTVLVAGGGSGIGAAVAARFAASGDTVVLADIDGPAAGMVADALDGASAVELDVTDADAVRTAVESIGRVDVLVTSVMAASDAQLADVSLRDWSRQVEVTLTGPFLLAQAVLAPMVASGGGAIVFISSVNALTSLGNEAYSAAKAGLLSLTRNIAVEYGKCGVRCNAVLPGTIHTPVWDRRLKADPEVLDRVTRWYPLGRVGRPDDVASAVEFLAGDGAGWISGVTLPVDGGLLAGNLPFSHEITIGAPRDSSSAAPSAQRMDADAE